MEINITLLGLFWMVLTHVQNLNSTPLHNNTESFSFRKYLSLVYQMFPKTKPRTYWIDAVPWTPSYDGHVYIPYYFDELDPAATPQFLKVVEEFSRKSCVRWVPAYNNDYYVVRVTSKFEPDEYKWCKANVGQISGSTLYLTRECVNNLHSNVAHEMFHVLGFHHEHQRKDRDCYIKVKGGKPIPPEDKFSYGVMNERLDESFPFDEQSIMEYSGLGKVRLDSLFGIRLGPVTDMPNESDWIRLNYAYCGQPHMCYIHPEKCARAEQVLRQCQRRYRR